jgi:Flp pilus assembly protein TadG
MTWFRSPLWPDRRALAAVEFALVSPLLFFLFGAIVDFGLLIAGRSALANGMAQGVQYALLKGPAVSLTLVQEIVQQGSALAGLRPVVDVSTPELACYCLNEMPASLTLSGPVNTSNYTCSGTCVGPSGAATPPSVYLTFRASYTFTPVMPLYSFLASPTVDQAVTVRLQ